MPLLTPPGYALAAIHCSGPVGTPEFVTTIGVQVGDGDVVTPEHANNVHSAFVIAFGDAFASGWSINKASLHFGVKPNGQSVDSVTPPKVCAGGGTRMPVQMAMVLQKKSGIGGRKHRGRMFLPGCLQTDMVDASGKVTGPQIGDFTNKCVTFLNELEVPTAEPLSDRAAVTAVILHSGPETPDDIIGLVPARQVGWIRSRG